MSEVQEVKRHGELRKGRAHTLAGVLVFAAGFFWFAKKAGWIPVHPDGSPLFWPAVVMVVGLTMVLGLRRSRKGGG